MIGDGPVQTGVRAFSVGRGEPEAFLLVPLHEHDGVGLPEGLRLHLLADVKGRGRGAACRHRWQSVLSAGS